MKLISRKKFLVILSVIVGLYAILYLLLLHYSKYGTCDIGEFAFTKDGSNFFCHNFLSGTYDPNPEKQEAISKKEELDKFELDSTNTDGVGLETKCQVIREPLRDYGNDIEILTIRCDNNIVGYLKHDLQDNSIALLKYISYIPPVCDDGYVNNVRLSKDDAITLVSKVPYIQEYMRDTEHNERTDINIYIENDKGSTECDFWQIWVFESVIDDKENNSGHAVTIARYLVDSTTGELWFKTDFTEHVIKVDWFNY